MCRTWKQSINHANPLLKNSRIINQLNWNRLLLKKAHAFGKRLTEIRKPSGKDAKKSAPQLICVILGKKKSVSWKEPPAVCQFGSEGECIFKILGPIRKAFIEKNECSCEFESMRARLLVALMTGFTPFFIPRFNFCDKAFYNTA